MPVLKKYFYKNISKLCFFLPLIFAFSARVAGAQCGAHLNLFCNPLESKTNNIADGVALVALYLLSIIGIITLVFMVIAGIRYIFSAGSEEKMKSAKDALYSSGLGLAVALLAYTILSVIHDILNS